MNDVVMGFGAILAITGILLFIKGVRESQNNFKGFGISFNITNPGIVIFVVGCVIFMTPYVITQSISKPAKSEADKIATGEKVESVEEDRKKAEKERLDWEENLKKAENVRAGIEAERERLAQERKKAEDDRRAKEEELAKLSGKEKEKKEQELKQLEKELKQKAERERLAHELAMAEEANRAKEQELAKLAEEQKRKEEQARAAANESEKRRLAIAANKAEEEKKAKEEEVQRTRAELQRTMSMAKKDVNLANLTTQMTRITRVAPGKINLPEPKRESHQVNIGDKFGDRNTFEFKVVKPGPIKIKASWQGPELALILNGPGQINCYSRIDGPEPLSLTYDVTQQILNRGNQWQVSVVNFSKKGIATGKIAIEYPE